MSIRELRSFLYCGGVNIKAVLALSGASSVGSGCGAIH